MRARAARSPIGGWRTGSSVVTCGSVLSESTHPLAPFSCRHPTTCTSANSRLPEPNSEIRQAGSERSASQALSAGIGRSFVGVAERKNQAEAEYRYALTRLRENGESIALLGGEDIII